MENMDPMHDYFENETNLQNISAGFWGGDVSFYKQLPLSVKIVIGVYICVIAVIGISGNILVATVLSKSKKMSSTDIYELALAVSDLVSLIVGCSIIFVRYTTNLWDRLSSDWICKLSSYTVYVSFVLSLLLIFGIAIDRYLLIFKPHTPSRVHCKAAKIACVTVYVVSAFLLSPFLFSVGINSEGKCVKSTNASALPFIAGSRIFVAFVGVVTLIVTFVAYMKIAWFLRKRAVIGVITTTHGSTQNKSASPLPGTSKQLTTTTIASTVNGRADNNIELQNSAKPAGVFESKTASNEPRIGRRPPKGGQTAQSSSRTTAIMVALTVIHFTTIVIPAAIPFIATGSDPDVLDVYIRGAVMFGKITNPILFAASSSVFRKRSREMLNSIRCL